MTQFAFANLYDADQTWFAENPDRTFRYHILDGHSAAELVNAEYGAPLDPDDVTERFVLAWRADDFGEIAHALVDMPLDEVRTRIEMAAEHGPDAFGLWLMLCDVSIRPRRPDRREVPVSPNMRAFLARLTAA
ncbi:MAG: hypothetical protein EOP24_00785 [Hyphomicrobiales bacterium]|nr:MAG: hypothetical protein EOP24_00785 [Hyphomicrobiales bacterium]